MPYILGYAITLGPADIGLTLEAQLVDVTGATVGATVLTGFVELGLGHYIWTGEIPDGFRGFWKFRLSPGGALKAITSVNPEEAENSDVKNSLIPAGVWGFAQRTLTSFGSLVRLIWSEVLPGTYIPSTAGYILGRLISGNIFTVTSALSYDASKLTLYRATDYKAEDGRAIVWTDTAGVWPDLTGSRPYLVLLTPESIQRQIKFNQAGKTVAVAVPNQSVQVELAASIFTIPAGIYIYTLLAELANHHVIVLARGDAEVINDH